MNKTYYGLALSAIKFHGPPRVIKRTPKGETHEMELEQSLRAWAMLAESEDEAKQFALEKAHEWWPVADGWGHHAVATIELSKEHLTEVVNYLSGELSNITELETDLPM